jgi:PilZ domain-containing protein
VRLTLQRLETERRIWPRLPLAIPVFVRSRDDKGKDFLEFATALNISASGVLVAVRRALPLSARILLEIPSAPLAATAKLPKASRTLRAKCVRVTHAEGYHLVGLKFSRPLLEQEEEHRAPARKSASARVKKFSLTPAGAEA